MYKANVDAPSHRFLISWIGIVLPIMIAILLLTISGTEPDPQLIIDTSVASDFEALAQETWEQFLVKFQARSDCFGDVLLKADHSLDDRAIYDPASATVTVRVPGSPALLQSALAHEWAHHIEFQCAEHEELRQVFLELLDMPSDTPWHSTNLLRDIPMNVWKEIPSEQYAEASVVFVLGTRHIPTKVRVSDEAVQIVAQWAAGDSPLLSPTVESRGD